MKPKYRIRAEMSDNGNRYYPEERGLLWGWNNLYLHVGYRDTVEVGYSRYDTNPMTLENAKRCIDFAIARDNTREEIIDYP